MRKLKLRVRLFMLLSGVSAFSFAQQVSPVPDTVRVNPAVTVKQRGLNPPKLRSFIVPAVFIGYGLVSLGNNAVRQLDFDTRKELHEDHPAFAHHMDNYLRYLPAVAYYGLNLAGVKSKHRMVEGTAIYALSQGIMGVSTFAVKKSASRLRPDGSDRNSFPSGHTASAFAAAEFMNQEFRDVSPFIGYAGYAVAALTGVYRLYNDKHWVSDVVAGAGFGIASTKAAYLIYPGLKRLLLGKKSTNYALVPFYQQRAAGLSFSGSF